MELSRRYGRLLGEEFVAVVREAVALAGVFLAVIVVPIVGIAVGLSYAFLGYWEVDMLLVALPIWMVLFTLGAVTMLRVERRMDAQ